MFATLSLRKSYYLYNKDLSVKYTADLSDHDIQTSLLLTLRLVASHIIHGNRSAAREILKTVIAENVDNPAIYNLFGISYERDGNRLKASRFYRVSYYMDQTFKAAADNLTRVCDFNYKHDIGSIAWGIDVREIK